MSVRKAVRPCQTRQLYHIRDQRHIQPHEGGLSSWLICCKCLLRWLEPASLSMAVSKAPAAWQCADAWRQLAFVFWNSILLYRDYVMLLLGEM